MTLFQQIPARTLKEARDHIMVITECQKITTFPIRDILQVTPSHKVGFTVVQCRNGDTPQITIIRENASAFLQRCQNLLEALTLGDVEQINQNFCPKRQPS